MSRMEIAIPSSPGRGMGFDFNDARALPFLSAPASPRRFGDLTLSAPTSPGRVAEFYRSFENFSLMGEYVEQNDDGGGVPFSWEEKPGTPKSPKKLPSFKEEDFAFDFSADLEKSSLPADELFDDGKIRPLKIPPRLEAEEIRSPLIRSPRSPVEQGKRIIMGAFSPRKKKAQAAVMGGDSNMVSERGRGRNLTSSSSRRGATRSLSPYRVSQYPWEEEERQFQQRQLQLQQRQQEQQTANVSSSSSSVIAVKSSSRKWRLRDLLLFRSASEGRATDSRDPYRKQTAFGGLFRRHEDVKSCSIRSSDSSSSGSMRKKGPVSAHELHYTKNKAASQDMKKRTFLPYKQGILGMGLAFIPSPAR